MRRFLLILAAVALCLSAADKKPKGRRPDIEVIEIKARRTEDKVVLDGRVRNGSEHSLEGVIITFDFYAPNKVPVTTQKTNLDEENFEAGHESTFHVAMVDPVRAVEIVVSGAEDKSGRDLRLAKVVRINIE